MRQTGKGRRLRAVVAATLSIVLVLALAGCSSGATTTDGGGSTEATPSEIVLASTTSTEDSGLFDVLIPAFEKANPEFSVKVVAVGTGEAIQLGKSKDADVLLVHAKDDEEALVAEGGAVGRYEVMYNDFIILGPPSDPAGIKGMTDANAAMTAIAKAGSEGKTEFISRGDDSGTHKKELKLWKAAGIVPTDTANSEWYVETGQGMGETLKIASEKQGYTISDRATYLSQKEGLDFIIALEKDPGLLNQYGTLPITEAKNLTGGEAFAAWVTSAEGQKIIGEFGVEEFGEQLFTPNATGTATFE